jgi:hypothetical protein
MYMAPSKQTWNRYSDLTRSLWGVELTTGTVGGNVPHCSIGGKVHGRDNKCGGGATRRVYEKAQTTIQEISNRSRQQLYPAIYRPTLYIWQEADVGEAERS